ncbi:MAG TPA: HIT family protein [Ktedonobacterales bacterium]|nr:HIT family protein [Ktedonobacterales bacterium]
MPSCLFCDVQQGNSPVVGGPVYEDDHVYAYHWDEEGSGYLGHLVLITRRHAPDFAALTPAEAQAVGLLIARLSSALKVCTGVEKVYTVFYGEVTPHLHVHLTARYREAPPEYLRWRAEDWPDAPRGDADAIAALCQRLREFLAENPQ